MAEVKENEPVVDVEQAFSKTEQYIEQNKKSLTVIIGAIVVLVGGYFAYKYWYVTGEEKQAQAEMYKAELFYEQDSLDKAIAGFTEVVDNYGITPSGNLAEYYLGMSLLKKGDFENAIEHLSEFKSNDQIVGPLATGAIGDAYMELGNTEEAISYYLKAADQSKNNFTSPVFLKKAGMAYENAGKHEDAVRVYEQIKSNYPETTEGREIEKYIARAKVAGKLDA